MTEAGYRKQKTRCAPANQMNNGENPKVHQELSYRILKIILLLMCGLALWGLLSWLFSSIPLRNLQVEGLTRYGEEEVLVTSGLSSVDKLLGVDREAVEQSLTAFYPYIRTARLVYAFPMGYRLVIEEEEAAYYTQIADDYFALSAELKVLEKAQSSRRFAESKLRRITLSGIQSAMLGETLSYDGDYLTHLLSEISDSVLADRVTDVIIGDRYHLSVICDDVYTLYLGDIHSIEAKMRLALLMMQDADLPQGYRAEMDVSDLKKTSIRFEGMQDASLSATD